MSTPASSAQLPNIHLTECDPILILESPTGWHLIHLSHPLWLVAPGTPDVVGGTLNLMGDWVYAACPSICWWSRHGFKTGCYISTQYTSSTASRLVIIAGANPHSISSLFSSSSSSPPFFSSPSSLPHPPQYPHLIASTLHTLPFYYFFVLPFHVLPYSSPSFLLLFPFLHHHFLIISASPECFHADCRWLLLIVTECRSLSVIVASCHLCHLLSQIVADCRWFSLNVTDCRRMSLIVADRTHCVHQYHYPHLSRSQGMFHAIRGGTERILY